MKRSFFHYEGQIVEENRRFEWFNSTLPSLQQKHSIFCRIIQVNMRVWEESRQFNFKMNILSGVECIHIEEYSALETSYVDCSNGKLENIQNGQGCSDDAELSSRTVLSNSVCCIYLYLHVEINGISTRDLILLHPI